MLIIKKLIIHVTLFMLFTGALWTTYTHMTNVSPDQLKQWLSDIKDTTPDNTSQQSEVDLHHMKGKVGIPTAEEVADVFSEEHDWSEYPSVEVIATGYTAGSESTGKNENHPEYGITYSGVEVKRDVYSTIAADPEVFPIGSILFIPGYGYGVVADTGSAIKGNRIDLYYETVDDVYNLWGKKEIDVYVIEKGNGSVSEDELIKLNHSGRVQDLNKDVIRYVS